MSYRWSDPHDWLMDKLEGAGEDAILAYAKAMVRSLDADTLQELFQNEMDADGYFAEMEA